jgi:hypothetical protein
VHKSRILFLCTILGSFLGAQIKNSLPLHQPPHFSWCTNQEFSFSAPHTKTVPTETLQKNTTKQQNNKSNKTTQKQTNTIKNHPPVPKLS